MKYIGQFPSLVMGIVFSLITILILYDLWTIAFITMLPGFAVRWFILLITPDMLREIRGPLPVLLLCLLAGYIINYWLRKLRRYAQNNEAFGFLRSFLGMFALFFIIQNLLFFADWMYWDLTIDNEEAILAIGRTWLYGIPFFVFFGLTSDLLYRRIRGNRN